LFDEPTIKRPLSRAATGDEGSAAAFGEIST